MGDGCRETPPPSCLEAGGVLSPGLLGLAAGAVAIIAFVARTAVLFGREPGGVDAWYYLAYARAFRKAPSLRVRVQGYLLQDEVQSYAPVFPTLLGLLPARILERWYWVVSPFVDCLTLLLLFLLSMRLTDSAAVAILASLSYAVSPTLVSETRALSPRSFAVLANVMAQVFCMRAVIGVPASWFWMAAIAAAAILFLTSATGAASYLLVSAALCVVFLDWRFAIAPLGGFVLAVILSGGALFSVVANYRHAARYWLKHRGWIGAHPILDSPVYGGPRKRPGGKEREPGFLGDSVPQQLLRLLGENPFLCALPFAHAQASPWTTGLRVWALSLSLFAITSIVVRPLRMLGASRAYMKSAIFPTAYVLAAGIGTPSNLLRPAGLITLTSLAASVAAIIFFLGYLRGRKAELNAHIPTGLSRVADELARAEEGGVVCLPGGYSDYLLFRTRRSVLWGSHSGSLEKFELVAPVWTERVETLARRFGVRYLVVEKSFLDPAVLKLDERCRSMFENDGFQLFDLGSQSS